MIHPDKLRKILEKGNPRDVALLKKYLTDPYYNFTPRPDSPGEFDEQSRFVNSRHHGITCAIAGNAAGKTLAGAFKTAQFLRETEPPVDLAKFFVLSQSLQQTGVLWQEKLSQYIPDALIESVQYYNVRESHPKTIIMKPHPGTNKRWMINFKSYEMGRKALQGASQVVGFWMDEQCTSMSLINEIDTRCREFDYPGAKIYTLTPLEPDEDLQERFDHPENYPYWLFTRMNAEKNYEAGGISTLGWLENTTDEMRETRRIGEFANFKGAIYKMFDPKKHVVPDNTPIPKHAIYYRVIDWGWTHDTAVLLVAVAGTKMWVVKEWGDAEKLIQEKYDAIMEHMPGDFITYADPEDRQQRQEMAKLGLHTLIARKEPVTYGIELVSRKFNSGDLLIFESCKKLISQTKNYRWKLPKEGAEDIKERPVKRDDDYSDCLRMIIHSLEKSSLSPWDMAKKITTQGRV